MNFNSAVRSLATASSRVLFTFMILLCFRVEATPTLDDALACSSALVKLHALSTTKSRLKREWLENEKTTVVMNSPLSSLTEAERKKRIAKAAPNLEKCGLVGEDVAELKALEAAIGMSNVGKLKDVLLSCANAGTALDQISKRTNDVKMSKTAEVVGRRVGYLVLQFDPSTGYKSLADDIFLKPSQVSYQPKFLESEQFKKMAASCTLLGI